MIKWFKLLSKLKFLRGTPFDIFGYTAERKMERRLIKEYEHDLKKIAVAKKTDAAIALAKLPLEIRGYGPVKDANAGKAAKRRLEILDALDSDESLKTAAE